MVLGSFSAAENAHSSTSVRHTRKMSRDGFTLVELIVAVAILSILTGLAILALSAGTVLADGDAVKIRGEYLEARTCSVWVGSCFSNSAAPTDRRLVAGPMQPRCTDGDPFGVQGRRACGRCFGHGLSP